MPSGSVPKPRSSVSGSFAVAVLLSLSLCVGATTTTTLGAFSAPPARRLAIDVDPGRRRTFRGTAASAAASEEASSSGVAVVFGGGVGGNAESTTTTTSERDDDVMSNRRDWLVFGTAAFATTPLFFRGAEEARAAAAYSGPTIDVNNALAREFTAFPGLYPTVATKIVNGAKSGPYKTKADVYAALDSDLERERLKQYDEAILVRKPDSSLKQFKESQICKYECGSRVSNAYRDEQIRAVQEGRR